MRPRASFRCNRARSPSRSRPLPNESSMSSACKLTLTLTLTLLAALPAAAANAQISVLSSTVEERVVAPGDRYSGTIVLSNPTPQAQTARIYQSDYRFTADGTSSFDPAGTTPRSNALWVVPQSARVTVPASSQLAVRY